MQQPNSEVTSPGAEERVGTHDHATSTCVSKVFINYRRSESFWPALMLFERLTTKLGKSCVFMDFDTLNVDRPFDRQIEQWIESCDTILVIIGPTWLNVEDTSGARRLDNPADYVRREIEAGLQRDNVRVVPLLVDGAEMPDVSQLPSSLAALSVRQAVTVHGDYFSDATKRLFTLLHIESDPVDTYGPLNGANLSEALYHAGVNLGELDRILAPLRGAAAYNLGRYLLSHWIVMFFMPGELSLPRQEWFQKFARAEQECVARWPALKNGIRSIMLDRLYSYAEELTIERRWASALNVLTAIRHIDSRYDRANDLLRRARRRRSAFLNVWGWSTIVSTGLWWVILYLTFKHGIAALLVGTLASLLFMIALLFALRTITLD